MCWLMSASISSNVDISLFFDSFRPRQGTGESAKAYSGTREGTRGRGNERLILVA